MPALLVSSIAEKTGIPIAEAEHRWKKAKAIAADEKGLNPSDGDEYWRYVTGVFKKAMGVSEDGAVLESVDSEAHKAATSPQNDIQEPTLAQKEAGNYQKGHVSIQGLNIAIENPKGSKRRGVSKDGKAWESTMYHHYGYIKGTVGRDKDQIDVFIGDKTDSPHVYVVNQVDPSTGNFDEHKIMLGFDSLDDADNAYHANYEKDWKGMGSMTTLSMVDFKDWLENGDTKMVLESGTKNRDKALETATAKANKNKKPYVLSENNGEYFVNALSSFTIRLQADFIAGKHKRYEVVYPDKIGILESIVQPNQKPTVSQDQSKKAMKFTLDTQKNTMEGISRPDVGWIAFLWGTPGTSPLFADGDGMARIIAKQDFEKKYLADEQSGRDLCMRLVDIVTRGYIKRKYGPTSRPKIDFSWQGEVATVSWEPARKTWYLSAWREDWGGILESAGDASTEPRIRHIRNKLRPRKGNSFYKDKSEREATTLCGAPCTAYDTMKPSAGIVDELCPDCMTIYLVQSPKPREAQGGSDTSALSGATSRQPWKDDIRNAKTFQDIADVFENEFGVTLDDDAVMESALYESAKTGDFVKAPNGTINFGQITPEIANIIKRPSGFIRMRPARESHIETNRNTQLDQSGFDKVVKLVYEIAQKYNQIYEGRGRSLILAETSGKSLIAYIELEPGEGADFYAVKSALSSRSDYLNKKRKLWDRAQSYHLDEETPSAISGQSFSDKIVGPVDDNVNKIFEGVADELITVLWKGKIQAAESFSDIYLAFKAAGLLTYKMPDNPSDALKVFDAAKRLEPLMDQYKAASSTVEKFDISVKARTIMYNAGTWADASIEHLVPGYYDLPIHQTLQYEAGKEIFEQSKAKGSAIVEAWQSSPEYDQNRKQVEANKAAIETVTSEQRQTENKFYATVNKLEDSSGYSKAVRDSIAETDALSAKETALSRELFNAMLGSSVWLRIKQQLDEAREEISVTCDKWQPILSDLTEKVYQSDEYNAGKDKFSQLSKINHDQINKLRAESQSLDAQLYGSLISKILELSPITEEAASQWATGQVIDKSVLTTLKKSKYLEPDIRKDMAELYRLSGGRFGKCHVLPRRKGQSRACADPDQKDIHIGAEFTKRTLWHEMGHLFEGDGKYKSVSSSFLQGRVDKTKGLQKLSDLTGNKNYRRDEVAYTDHLFDAYAGKYYRNGITEVLSMGIQQFSSPELTAELEKSDPEMFHLITGLLATPPSEAEKERFAAELGQVAAKLDEQKPIDDFYKMLDKKIKKNPEFYKPFALLDTYQSRKGKIYSINFNNPDVAGNVKYYSAKSKQVVLQLAYLVIALKQVPDEECVNDFNRWGQYDVIRKDHIPATIQAHHPEWITDGLPDIKAA